MCFTSDYQLGADLPAATLKRISHLVKLHNSTQFMNAAPEGRQLLSEISHLLGTQAIPADVLESIVESCNPYNYSLIRTLLLASQQELCKKVYGFPVFPGFSSPILLVTFRREL